jgi:hypothetical protein
MSAQESEFENIRRPSDDGNGRLSVLHKADRLG